MTILMHPPQQAQAKQTVVEAAAGRESALEPKLDGWRLIASTDSECAVSCFTRSGTNISGKMPHIEALLGELMLPNSTLDGEVVAFEQGPDGLIHSWGKVQSALGAGHEKAQGRSHALTFVVFDVLEWSGHDTRRLPLRDRRELLEAILKTSTEAVQIIPQLKATEANYQRLIELGYEGGIVKWLDSPYASGQRGKGFFKLKASHTIDAVIIGYKPGNGHFTGLIGSIEFGQYDEDGCTVSRGHCSGMDMATRRQISEDQWGHLGLVIEIAHMGFQEEGFRHPQFRRFRPDRIPESIELHNE